ncbi:MAG: hypothetical protein Aurels2KO_24690 [Aureliella sp.]
MTTQLANLDSRANSSAASLLQVGWVGGHAGGLEWLRNAVSEHSQVTLLKLTLPADPRDQPLPTLDSLPSGGIQRLIVSASNRSHLDHPTIHRMQQIAGEIPLAIAGDTWLDGSRRTGSGETGTLLLPWYRWWDGWHEWLFRPTEPTLRAWTTPTAHLTAPESVSLEPARPAALPKGLVIADCQQTAAGWRASISYNPYDTQPSSIDCISSCQLPNWQGDPEWILVDDTADFLQIEETDGPMKGAQALRGRFPDATIVIATTICRADQWLPVQEIPDCELIAKPSTGRSLRYLLNYQLRHGQ